MIDFIKNVRWSLLFIGILTIVIGVAMVMYPQTATETIVKILGGLVAASAIVSILGYFIDRARGINSFTSLLVGSLLLIIGGIMYLKPTTFIEFLNYIFGVLVFILGINLMIEGVSSRKYHAGGWGQIILMGLICIAFGVLIVFNPFGEKVFLILTGICFILAGIMNVFVSGRIGYAVHTFNKAVKAVEKEMTENVTDIVNDSDVAHAIETADTVETLESEKEIELLETSETFKEGVTEDNNEISHQL